jgi:hypothetical protein
MFFALLVIYSLVCGVLSALLADAKNLRPVKAFFLGAFLGVVGLAIVAVTRRGLPKAPEGMRAVKCPRCNAVQNVAETAADWQCWQCNGAFAV